MTTAPENSPLVGIGYRHELRYWINSNPEVIDCLEITAEHFFNPKLELKLKDLSQKYPIIVHGSDLSPGSPGPLDCNYLEKLSHVVSITNPLWVSEYLGFSRTPEVDLGYFNSICPNQESIHFIADHVQTLRDTCNKPVILENISTALRITGTLSETVFLNQLCEQADCGLLLDIASLFVNSQNHNYDPYSWLYDIDPQHIQQLHVAGYNYADKRWFDLHQENIQNDLWELTYAAIEYAPVRAVTIERDANFPAVTELERELKALKHALNSTQNNKHGTLTPSNIINPPADFN